MHSEWHLFVILGSARFVSTVVLWVDGEEGSFVFEQIRRSFSLVCDVNCPRLHRALRVSHTHRAEQRQTRAYRDYESGHTLHRTSNRLGFDSVVEL